MRCIFVWLIDIVFDIIDSAQMNIHIITLPLIVSNDSIIMNPPYQITPKILRLVTSVSEKIGQISAKYLDKPSPKLRKENKIKTIHSSLSIEGNTLTEVQITALLEKKRVIGPEKDVNEVLNAIKVYDRIQTFDSDSISSFLSAHEILMKGLISDYGRFRQKNCSKSNGQRRCQTNRIGRF